MAKRKPGWKTGAVASLLLVALPAAAAQLKSATYFALQRGMTESELLVRAGPPDLVTHPGGQVITHRSAVGAVAGDDRRLGLIGGYARTRYIEIKEYHYIPDHTEHDQRPAHRRANYSVVTFFRLRIKKEQAAQIKSEIQHFTRFSYNPAIEFGNQRIATDEKLQQRLAAEDF